MRALGWLVKTWKQEGLFGTWAKESEETEGGTFVEIALTSDVIYDEGELVHAGGATHAPPGVRGGVGGVRNIGTEFDCVDTLQGENGCPIQREGLGPSLEDPEEALTIWTGKLGRKEGVRNRGTASVPRRLRQPGLVGVGQGRGPQFIQDVLVLLPTRGDRPSDTRRVVV